jgi:long-chain acyl-CoA synthetase
MKNNHPWLKSYPKNLNWDFTSPEKHAYAFLTQAAKQYGTQPAVDFLGQQSTWNQINEAAQQFAASLQKMGIGKGSKVGLFLPNCPLFISAYYGILMTGATIVNYNPLYAPRELIHQIEDSETEVILTLDLKMLLETIEPLLDKTCLKKLIIAPFTPMLPFPKNILFKLFKGKDLSRPRYSDNILNYNTLIQNAPPLTPVNINPAEDIALLQYTGGTTGTPKGAMLTHKNIYSNALQCHAHFPKTEEQGRMLAVLPFFHVFAMTVTMNLAAHAGMEILTLPRFDLQETLKLIHRRKPHYMAAVPAILNGISNTRNLEKSDFSSLSFCISGGAPLPVEIKKTFENRTGCTVVEGYGLTEASPVTHVNPPFGDNIAGSIGLPLPGTIVEIIDREDKVTPMPTGERGEVCIRGPQVMKGYWKKPDATQETLQKTEDGEIRLHTGDVGFIDEQGYTFIVDRIKDMIITNGYNVYPRNIEEAIHLHDAVEECIVAGLPDTQRGEIVKAWIKLKDGQTLGTDELKTFLKDKISPMEMPKRIEFRTTPLPKTMIGKLSRKDVVTQELENKRKEWPE